jgi:methyl-accepting chemotaxis protein
MVLMGIAAGGLILLTALLLGDVAPTARGNALMISAGVGLGVLGALIYVGLRTWSWLQETLGGEPAEVAEIARKVAAGTFAGNITRRSGDTTSLLATIAELQAGHANRGDGNAADIEEENALVAAIGRSMAVIEFGLDGTILTANTNFLSTFGYSLEEIRGRHHSLLVAPEEANGAEYRGFWEKLRSGQYDAGQYRRVGKGGRVVWLQASYNPVLDATGKPCKVVKFATDVTEQVRTTEEVRQLAQAAAGGDLTRRISTQGKSGNLLSLTQAINSMAEGMTDIVGQIRTAVEAVRCGTDEISKGNTDLSQRTEEQASSLEETASSMEEMTSTVKQNADNAAQANQLAAAARAQAEKGGAVVSEAVAAMAGINEASKKIADIIGVIDEIAFQTNLLALNAAVEAARAGEQGRGFAVVAAEVRTLASRSAAAAKEIKSLIQDSVAKVEHGSKLVGQSGQSLSDIVTAVKKATDIVAEIAAACQEQASGIDQVNKAVTSLDQVTQQNAALVEQAASAAEALSEEAQRLDSMMANYQIVGGSAGVGAVAPPAASNPEPVGRTRPELSARVERRKAGRPWSDRPASAGRATAAKPAVAASRPVAKAAGAGGSGDSEWAEF